MGKQIKTPRFYVDIPTFLHATGQLGWDGIKGGAELLYMNCANPSTNTPSSESLENTLFLIGDNLNRPKTAFPINFCALLNHNFATDKHIFKVVGRKFDISDANNEDYTSLNKSATFNENILNLPAALTNPQFNGTSIWTIGSTVDGINEYWTSFQIRYDIIDNDTNTYIDMYEHQLGSMVIGRYFDCPVSPDLSLTMSRRFDGIKKQSTIGGKVFSNVYYDGPAEWKMSGPNGTYRYPPFELDISTQNLFDQGSPGSEQDNFNKLPKTGLGRKGMRSWDLSFSYVSETNMWINNEVSNTITSDNTISDRNPSPILSDKSFNFVWNCTLGGALPFIFTDDKDSNEPDRYAKCMFRENTFSVEQVAPNTYNLSMTIDEIS